MMLFANLYADTGEIYAVCSELLGLPDKKNFVEVEEGVDVGWRIVDGVAVAPPAPEPVPEPLDTITKRQFKLELIELEKDDDLEAIIAAMPTKQQKMIRAELDASEYHFDNPFVSDLATALGFSEEEKVKFWREAAMR